MTALLFMRQWRYFFTAAAVGTVDAVPACLRASLQHHLGVEIPFDPDQIILHAGKFIGRAHLMAKRGSQVSPDLQDPRGRIEHVARRKLEETILHRGIRRHIRHAGELRQRLLNCESRIMELRERRP